MALTFASISLLSLLATTIQAASFTVPASVASNASIKLITAPNFKDLTGQWPLIRIGGTTQGRATYNASQTDAVKYSVTSSSDAPASLTFGPSFMTLAGQYGGPVTLDLNRCFNNQPNTINAALSATANMSNLNAIELGNEPNYYSSSDPIAGGSWSAFKDFSSQVSWQSSVSTALGRSNIFSAGVYFGSGTFNNQGLSAQEGSSIATVKDFCSHNYSQSSGSYNLATLMSHSAIKTQIAPFKAEYSAAAARGRTYVMGETNSATQAGGGISPTFGASLWILDYVMQSLILGVQSLYFHQGTIGNCQYCWWGRYDMGTPYHGAYFATLALASASQIAPLDDGSTNYAGYAIFSRSTVTKILLYNSDHYSGSDTRGSQTFTVTGLQQTEITAKRLTAASATSRQDQGQNPTVGGQTFANGTCVIQGAAAVESVTVSRGVATFSLKASEALLIYL